MRLEGTRATLEAMAFRVLIVDDNGAFLYAARRLLAREGLQVVGIAATGAEALRRVGDLRPDVVLVDIELAQESGFEVARRLIDHDPEGPAVILVSTHAEEDLAELIDESPAIGFLPKAGLSAPAIRGLVQLSRAAGATARPGT
jgi:CheY-like chemotaxis protein